MVSKKLQDKFYAALESLKDGKNDYILEALAAGAKATFEGLIGGVDIGAEFAPPKDDHPDSAMVAEAVAKLKSTIGSLKTKDNRSIIEAIEQGCDACFGSGCTEDAPSKNWSVTVHVRNSIGGEGELKYLVTAPDENTACERAKNGVSADHPNLHPQDATAVPYTEV